jgi:hypothetical protein
MVIGCVAISIHVGQTIPVTCSVVSGIRGAVECTRTGGDAAGAGVGGRGAVECARTGGGACGGGGDAAVGEAGVGGRGGVAVDCSS